MTNENEQHPEVNPPAFNIPGAVLAIGALIIIVHGVRTTLISQQNDYWVLAVFAFIPVSYHLDLSQLVEPLARFWSPLTHGFLHGDWTHVLVNLVWLAAFGSAVARRFKALRFFVFMGLATMAGAAAHYVFYPMGAVPVIGASGAVSACMGAAVRFAFTPGRSIEDATNSPALSLLQSLKNRGIMTFVIFWFGLNYLIGSGILPLGVEGQIAWEAHMGGFLFGWLCFAAFDRKPSG